MSQHHAALHQGRWEASRQAKFTEVGRRCEQCGRAGRLEVHHIEELRHGGAPYELTNLRVLCRSCHIAYHKTRKFITPTAQAWRVLVEEMMECAS